VYVIASARADFDPASVLFEFKGVRRDTAPSREKGQKVAPAVSTGAPFSRTGNERVECDAIIPVADPAYCLETTCNDYSRADGFNMIATPIALAENTIGRQPQNGGNGDGFTVGGPMYTLNATGVHGVAQPIIGGVDYENNAHGPDDVTGPLLKGSPTGGGRPLPAVALANMAVRRLTPVECERLQGFPDGYTNIRWRKKEESPDGPRYKALGNSWAVPVITWIGKRIDNAIA
jgi:DNA (cytosine-5)-methyltransferase 1